VDEEKLRVVFNGVDVERFHPRNREAHRDGVRRELGTPADAPVLLHVTNNFRLKGLATLLEALAALRGTGAGKGAELWVLGRGRVRAYARDVARLGLSDAVRFLGWRPQAERFYASADVYAHPTFYDACSLSILEAMASGLPVVTTATNGASAYVDEGVNGFVIPDAADAKALADRLERALDTAFRQGAPQAARAKAEQFPLSRNTEEVLAVYREVAALSKA
jgi:UDP-glucose:(heptosyl)LPS alpha-1,3-glucosyltransferase